MLSAAQAPRYVPRPATNDLKEIVEDGLEELLRDWDTRFRDTYGALHPRVKDLLEAFIRCGDLHFGFVRVRCVNPDCSNKDEKLVAFSCKTRGLCPSCGQRRAIEWAERMVEFVLPSVPYRQLVFTIPIALRKPFLFDRSLYGQLCRVAYGATRDYMRERAPWLARQSRAVPAMVVSPQSFGDLLVPHPHAHSVVSLGLFRKDGRYFPMEDIDFSGLEQLFRERFFEMMLKHEKILPETVERLRSWEHSGFQADSSRRIDADDRTALEGLLSYMERPAVSLRRLEYRTDGMVRYRGTRFHPRLGTDQQLLSPVEFLAMLVPHIALKYEVIIRSYGAVSTTFRRRAGWLQSPPTQAPPRLAMASPRNARDPDPGSSSTPPELAPRLAAASGAGRKHDGEDVSDFIRRRRRGWAKLIAKIWGGDPGACGTCGEPMKIISAIGPDQPEVIERILRHRKLWNPPWKAERRARGPPPSRAQGIPRNTRAEAPESPERVPTDQDYCVDPPAPDDLP